MHGMRDAENMYRDLAGLRENLVRDDGIGKPYRGSSSRSFAATHSLLTPLLGSLNNDDSDGNENGKKAIGLD